MPDGRKSSGTKVSGRDHVKQLRKENPSGWLSTTLPRSKALVIDAILDAPPEYEFTAPELGERAGVSDESVRGILDDLQKLGVVEKMEGYQYGVLDDSRVLTEIYHLNSAVNTVQAGISSPEITRSPEQITEKYDNAQHDTTSDQSNLVPNGYRGPMPTHAD